MSAIPLHLAAFDGDTDTVNRFLVDDASIVNERTSEGETPLLFAVLGGHTNTVRNLLKWGANVNLLPAQGNSALRRAIRGGHADTVRLLIASGADPDAVVPEKVLTAEAKAEERTKLRAAMEAFRKEMIAFGVDEKPDDLDGFLSDGPDDVPVPREKSGVYRCLMMAIQGRSVETLRVLLEAGYSPQAESGNELAPSLLEFARSVGTGVDMGQLLLRYGANPDGNDSKNTPLMMAVMQGDLPFAKLLIEAGAKPESSGLGMGLLSCAVMREDAAMIEFLLDSGVGLDDPMIDVFTANQKRLDLKAMIDRKRGSAWLSLVRAGDVEGARLALQNGANVAVRDGKHGSALEIAAKEGDAAMVSLLLEAGADAAEANDHGVTPLHIAATAGASDVALLLIQKGVSVTAENRFGQTPLLCAAMRRHDAVADILTQNGAAIGVVEAILLGKRNVADDFWQRGIPVDYANEAGMTALHAAIVTGDAELASTLLHRGADVNRTDHTKYTPLLRAIESENREMVRLLLDAGADRSGGAGQFKSPLYRAAMTLNEPIVRLLLERGAPLVQVAPELPVQEPAKSAWEQKMREAHAESWHQRAQLVNELVSMYRFSIDKDDKNPDDRWADVGRIWRLLRTLIAFGADVNGVDDEQNPLLKNLLEWDAPLDLIQFVLAKGAQVNPTNTRDAVPLMLAIDKVREDVVAALLAAGANPNGGLTAESPLQMARRKSLAPIVTLLEEHGASDERRQEMVTALGDAADFLLRPVEDSHSSSFAKMLTLDLGSIGDQMREERQAEIAKRRESLAAELKASFESDSV